MQSTARWTLLALLVVTVVALGGCRGTVFYDSPAHRASVPPPSDLPENPDPCVKYCREWVPPTYRMRPRLCKKCCGRCVSVPETVMVTSATDVCTQCRPKRVRYGGGCTCNETLVQTKPGGYRWETDGKCWHYCYRNPQYKWCNKCVQEDKIDFCYCPPPKWETHVTTVPVTRMRREYIPAQYEIEYCPELWTPGHYRWKASCDPCWCTPDWRRHSRPQRVAGCNAIDGNCPRCN